jgi:uncharacterized protein (UPF0332 family)
MGNWREMGKDSLDAAKSLLRDGRYRSSISRSYYAVFSAATEELTRLRVPFEYNRDHPTHRQLPNLLQKNLRLRHHYEVSRLVSVIKRLYKARIDADYVRGATIDENLARNMVRDAHTVLSILGI